MKKLLFLVLIIILIPFIIVKAFEKKEEHKFNYNENRIIRVKHDDNDSIEEVPLEKYVIGVVSGEMPIYFEDEALKAQAVAARTYVMKKMEYSSSKDYDIIDTAVNQVYLTDEELKEAWQDKYNEYISKVKKAVLGTRGEYMTYDGEVIEAFFFSTSTGMTENSGEIFQTQLPYLVSVSYTWDGEVSPLYDTTTTFTLDEFYSLLGLKYSNELNIEKTKTTSVGRTKEIKINGVTFSGYDFITKLNLRSTYFDIKQDCNNVLINIK